MPMLKHPCPNPECRIVLEIPRQVHWHRVQCSVCGRIFDVPPTQHSLAVNRRPSRRLKRAS